MSATTTSIADADAETPSTDASSTRKDYPKLVTLGVLHMAQYFPAAFTGAALPFLFRQEGLPLEMFWLLAVPGYSRWFKWLIALAVDNYSSPRIGHRKTWIIPCTVIGAFTYAMLAFIPPSLSTVYMIIGILLFKSFVMAAQDIAVDAYAAESMTAAERPTGTSIINFLGAVAGVMGSGTIALIGLFGWPSTMLAASALLIIAALPAVLRKEPPPPEATRKRMQRGEGPSLLKAIMRPESLYILPFMFMLGFGGSFAGSMIAPFFVDEGLSLTDWGILQPISALVGGGLGAVSTPWLVARIGLRKTATLSLALFPIEGLMFGAFAWMPGLPALPLLIAMVSLFGFGTALYGYCASISRFRWVSRAQAGTDYSMQSSIWNLGVTVGASLSGFVAAAVGWVVFFPIAGLISASACLMYVLIHDRAEKLVLAREQVELADDR